jgi:hypothetical protein
MGRGEGREEREGKGKEEGRREGEGNYCHPKNIRLSLPMTASHGKPEED